MRWRFSDRVRRAPLRLLAAATALGLLGVGGHPVRAARPAPGGPFVAYLDGAEVWVRDLSTPASDRKRLATVIGATKVRWSASGRKLAVEGENGLTIVAAQGSGSVTIPCDGNWAWAPTGDRLAFLHAEALRLREEDGRTRILFKPGRSTASNTGGLAWSPDGRRLAFVRENGRGRDYATLCTLRLDGKDLRELYQSRGEERAPVAARWSPDGRQVLFWALYQGRAASINADGIPFLSVPAAGGEAVSLAGDDVLVRREGYFDYSPDGRSLLLARGSGRFDVQNKRIAQVDTRTGRWKWLTPPTMAASAPRFSPDGRRIAFISVPDSGGEEKIAERSSRRRLWVMNADGSGRKALTSDARYADTAPRWLPGGRLLFMREPKEGSKDHAGLWTIDPMGGKPVQVAELLGELAGEETALFDVSPR